MANSANDAAAGFKIMMIERIMQKDHDLQKLVAHEGLHLGTQVSEQQVAPPRFDTGIDKPREL